MRRILLIDNYDSFTYNLEHCVIALGTSVDVVRNDVVIQDPFIYDGIILSPGPGVPCESKGMMALIQRLEGKIPILGVCLGMQAIAVHLGGELFNQNEVKHGVEEIIDVSDSPLFYGIGSELKVGLYHSWAVVDGKGKFEIIARSSSGLVMGIQNSEKMMYGVQFHPESIMTSSGNEIIQNFLNILNS